MTKDSANTTGVARHLTFALMLMACLPNAAFATSRALIIAVSEYANFADAQQLRGPYNDARRVRETLLRQGFRNEDIVILANCPRGAGVACEERFPTPTRAAIRDAFAATAGRVARGDYVYLHFAGHGSQQPVPPGSGRTDEPDDGLDEIFLPSDAGRWDGKVGAVANALTDNEISAWVTRLRNGGAFVWAVFDTCHSGTMLRGAREDSERDRGLDAVADLAIPVDLLRNLAERVGVSTPGLAGAIETTGIQLNSDAAGFAALYAAQPDERTPELGLPSGQSPRQVHGLFTFTLMQVLDTHPQLTYEQAAAEVLNRYESLNRPRPVPMFEGTDPGGRVLGRREPARPSQWPLVRRGEELVLPAGSLHEIVPGTTFLVVPEPASPDAAALGMVEVTRTGLNESAVRPIASQDGRLLAVDALPGTAHVRLLQRALQLRLRVAEPSRAQLARPELAAVKRAIDGLHNESNLLLEWVGPGEPADVHLFLDEARRVWLLPSSGEFDPRGSDRPLSVAVPAGGSATAAKDLAESLVAIARVLNLLRIAEDTQLSQQLIESDLLIGRAGSAAMHPAPEMPRANLRDGDRISLEVRNTAQEPLDLTVLFVDGRYGISVLFPNDSRPDNRIGPGSTHRMDAKVTADTAGVERLIIIATAAAGASRADFRFLGQDALAAGQIMERRAALDPLEKLLAAAGLQGGTTRGLTAPEARSVAIKVLAWHTTTGTETGT